ncbi:hypothetical protein [Streptomyces sp. 900105245]
MTYRSLDAGQQPDEMITQRRVARGVYESPCLFDPLAKVSKRRCRVSWWLLKKAAQRWVTRESYPKTVKVVASCLILWFGLLR